MSILNIAPAIPTPTNQAELSEVLADPKWAHLHTPDGAAGMAELISNYTKAQNRGDLASQIVAEVKEGLGADLVELLREQGGVQGRPDLTNAIGAEPVKGTGAIRNAAYNPQAVGAPVDKIGFDGMADFLRTIHHRNVESGGRFNGEKLKALQSIQDAYSSNDPASAGFLIPEEFRAEILQLALEQAVVRPRATVLSMGSLTQTIPFVDSTTNQGSVYGGMIFYWTPESQEILTSESKFGRVKLEANKLTGGARIPNELYADATALTSFIMNAAPKGLAFFEDLGFLHGSGVGEPLGALNSAAKIEVAKETSQAADSIVLANILKMYSRMLPSSLGSAVWLVNQTCIEQLLSLTIEVGTGGAPVNLVNVNSAPNWTMLGRPVIVTEKVPAIGDAGDVSFIDFGYYLIGDRQAVSMESSTHSRFMNDETELKIIERVDGRPWVQSAFQPYAGATVSPVVTLAARA
jgi:HK97 family phage major capsid protein